MLRRPRLDPTGNAVEALVEQRTQRPAGAVAGQHVEVVDVQVRLAMRGADLGTVNLVQPVVGGDLAGHVENQPAQRIALVGVGAHAPVLAGKVLVHRGGDIDDGLAVAAQTPMPLAIDDVGTRSGVVSRLHQHPLDGVLHQLHVHDPPPESCLNALRQHLRRRDIEFARCAARRLDCPSDLVAFKGHQAPIALTQRNRVSVLCKFAHCNPITIYRLKIITRHKMMCNVGNVAG